MSASNGDKARYHRLRKSKLVRREHIRALHGKLARTVVKPTGAQL